MNRFSGLTLLIIVASFSLLTLTQAGVTSNPGKADNFEDFQRVFDKKFKSSADREKHRAAFEARLKEIDELNQNEKGDTRYGVNSKSDFTPEQIQVLLSFRPQRKDDTSSRRLLQTGGTPPPTLNYLTQGFTTRVKDQGGCGSCWAFSSTSYMETIMLRDGQGAKDLAEQYLLECETQGGSSCNGGYGFQALDLGVKGMPAETDYPYKADDDYYKATLMKPICTVNAPGTSFSFLQTNISTLHQTRVEYSWSTTEYPGVTPPPPKTPAEIKYRLSTYGPFQVGIGVDAKFNSYAGGVLSCQTSTSAVTSVNHLVLLVGYTETEWIIKNQWGTSWGEGGYARITNVQSFNSDCQLSRYLEYIDNLNFQTPLTRIQMTGVNGWKGASISITQGNAKPIYFGENFMQGTFVTLPVNINTANPFTVVAVSAGSASSEVGFKIVDQQGVIACERQAGQSFVSGQDLCAPPAVQVTYSYRLGATAPKRGSASGYSGVVLGFRQNGIVQEFGQGFTSGTSYGPVNVVFEQNKLVEIVVVSIPKRTSTSGLSYSVYNPSGSVVASRSAGTSFVQGAILGSFTPA